MQSSIALRTVRHRNIQEIAANPYSGGHASAPVLLAVSVVAIVGSVATGLLLPSALGPMLLIVAGLMIGSLGLMLYSLYARGEIIEAQFDPERRRANFLYRGPVAHTEWHVPFDRIRAATMAINYDAKGKKIFVPTLELADGDVIVLPEATTRGDLLAIRSMIDPGVDKSAEVWARKANERANYQGRRPVG